MGSCIRIMCRRGALLAAALMLAACGTVQGPASQSPPKAVPAPAPALPAPAPVRPVAPADTAPPPTPPPSVSAPPPGAAPAPSVGTSSATTERAYRRDAASHLYAINATRIYKGVMQPQLYAIGVLDVDIDGQGRVTNISWRRAPSHAPEVMAEIVRTVRAAAPYPAPTRLGRVTYTDIWLWDKSGKFQLDTLTEGQL